MPSWITSRAWAETAPKGLKEGDMHQQWRKNAAQKSQEIERIVFSSRRRRNAFLSQTVCPVIRPPHILVLSLIYIATDRRGRLNYKIDIGAPSGRLLMTKSCTGPDSSWIDGNVADVNENKYHEIPQWWELPCKNYGRYVGNLTFIVHIKH